MKKRMQLLIYACLAVLLLSAITACKKIDWKNYDWKNYEISNSARVAVAEDGKKYNMLVKVEPQYIDVKNIPKSITIKITNFSDKTYRSWHRHIVEYYDGEDWVLIDAPGTTFDVAVIVEPNRTLELSVQLLISNIKLDYDYESNSDSKSDSEHVEPSYTNIDIYKKGKYRVRYDQWYGEFVIY